MRECINILITVDDDNRITGFRLAQEPQIYVGTKIEGDVQVNCSKCSHGCSIQVFTSPEPKEIVIKSEPLEVTEFKQEEVKVVVFMPEENVEEEELPEPEKRPQRTLKKKEVLPVSFPCGTGSCSETFTTKKKLEAHEKTCHRCLKCPTCDREYTKILALRAHMRGCKPGRTGKPKCRFCEKEFSTWNYAERHMNSLHLKVYNFICDLCGKQLKSKRAFEEHIMVHKDRTPYQCDICGKRVKSKNTMLNHILLKHKEDYNFLYCNQCNPPKKFLYAKSLELHAKKHTSVKSVKCLQCSKTFKSEMNIKQHVYRYHTPLQLKKKFTCEVEGCGFVTTVKAQFTVHRFKHMPDDQKPIRCQYCKKGFPNNHAKMQHEWIHTGYRPFGCEVCGKTFRTNASLKIHFRLHSGFKPYECEICHQRYSDRGCYRSHILVHEKHLGISLSKSVRKFATDYTTPRIID